MSRSPLSRRSSAPSSAAFLALLLAGLLPACGDSATPSGSSGETCEPGKIVPTVAWKRTGAVLADLGRALSLAPEEVCLELGETPCADVHRVALGENDPFDRALYRPFSEPLGTTPLAAERVVLHACVTRVELDRASAAPVVFTHLDLDADSAGADLGADGAFGKDMAELGRRLLSRDLSTEEIAVLAELAVDDAGAKVPAADVAKLACFTLGTSQEALFF